MEEQNAPEQRKNGRLRALLLSKELDDALCTEAAERKKPLSWVLREALITFLVRHGHNVGAAANPASRGDRSGLYLAHEQFGKRYLTTLLDRIRELQNDNRRAKMDYDPGLQAEQLLRTRIAPPSRNNYEPRYVNENSLEDALDERIGRIVAKYFDAYLERLNRSQQESGKKEYDSNPEE